MLNKRTECGHPSCRPCCSGGWLRSGGSSSSGVASLGRGDACTSHSTRDRLGKRDVRCEGAVGRVTLQEHVVCHLLARGAGSLKYGPACFEEGRTQTAVRRESVDWINHEHPLEESPAVLISNKRAVRKGLLDDLLQMVHVACREGVVSC